MLETRDMAKTNTLESLVAARDAQLATVAGLITADTPEADSFAIVAWSDALREARDNGSIMAMVASCPPALSTAVAIPVCMAQLAVVNFVPPTKTAAPPKRMVKGTCGEKVQGGLYVALSGSYTANFNKGLSEYRALVDDVENVKAHIRGMVDAGARIVTARTVVKLNADTNGWRDVTELKYIDVDKTGVETPKHIILGPADDIDDIRNWLGL